MSDEITRTVRGNQGRYALIRDGVEAELTYTIAEPGLITADHTGVPKKIGGQGVGQILVARMVKDARAEGVKIVPRCSYVSAQARRHTDWQDVIVT